MPDFTPSKWTFSHFVLLNPSSPSSPPSIPTSVLRPLSASHHFLCDQDEKHNRGVPSPKWGLVSFFIYILTPKLEKQFTLTKLHKSFSLQIRTVYWDYTSFLGMMPSPEKKFWMCWSRISLSFFWNTLLMTQKHSYFISLYIWILSLFPSLGTPSSLPSSFLPSFLPSFLKFNLIMLSPSARLDQFAFF